MVRKFCSACGAEATEIMIVEFVTLSITNGTRRSKVVNIGLCESCSKRVSRTLARDVEQETRVARALTDEGRQLRKAEAWERRKALFRERAEAEAAV